MFTLRLLGGLALEDSSGPVTGRAAQKRRLALLALLTTAPSRTLSRDKLIGYLWPESETEQARHLLSVALYELRKALGEETLVSRGDDVALEGEGVRSDVEAFERALDEGATERAVELYAGPLLDGFYLSDAPEFEHWVDAERDRLARRYQAALESLAEGRAAAGDARGAVEVWRRLAGLDPYNTRVTIGLVRALAAAGDRASALQQVRVHEVLLREEFGAEPDAELVALAARLREEPAAELPAATPQPAVGGSRDALRSGAAEAAGVEVVDGPASASPAPSPEQGAPLPGWGAPGADQPAAATRRARRRWRTASVRTLWRLGPVVALSVTLLVAIGTVAWHRWAPPAGGDAATIAVLPFEDVSPTGGNEYISDGLTEELINALASVDGLRVAARTSSFAFKGRGTDVTEVGQALNVRHVLEGSVRKVGDQLRITIQLADVRTGEVVWSRPFNGDLRDVIRLQDEIARSVVREVRGELIRGAEPALARNSTADPEAYDLYLKGRYHWYRRTGDGFRQAIRYFQEAIERDPGYALAYAGLADVYILLGAYDYGVLPPKEALPRAKQALSRALELDPSSAEAHAALGDIHLTYDWDWAAAERQFQRALELNPGYAPAYHWYALNLVVLGREAEALAAIRRARELEPLSLVMTTGMARILYFNRQYPRSIVEYRRALEMDSSFVTGRLGLGLAYVQSGMPERAVAEYQTALRLLGGPQPVVQALIAHAQAVQGRHPEARAMLSQLTAAARRRYVPAEYIALVHLGLGERDQALQWLERAHQNQSGSMAFMGVEPLLDPLRDDPRFQALKRRVGVP